MFYIANRRLQGIGIMANGLCFDDVKGNSHNIFVYPQKQTAELAAADLNQAMTSLSTRDFALKLAAHGASRSKIALALKRLEHDNFSKAVEVDREEGHEPLEVKTRLPLMLRALISFHDVTYSNQPDDDGEYTLLSQDQNKLAELQAVLEDSDLCSTVGRIFLQEFPSSPPTYYFYIQPKELETDLVDSALQYHNKAGQIRKELDRIYKMRDQVLDRMTQAQAREYDRRVQES